MKAIKVTRLLVLATLLGILAGSFALADAIPAARPATALDLDLGGGKAPAGVTCWGAGAQLQVPLIDGRPALALVYQAARTTTAGVAIDRLDLPADAGRVTVEMRVAQPTSVAIDLYEAGGARYQAFYWMTAGDWRSVDMPLGEFWLAEGSTDADGRLDPDQVRRMTITDLANLPGQVGMALGLKDGAQEMDVRRLYVGPGTAVARGEVTADRAEIDDRLVEPLALLPIGGPGIAVADLGGGPELEVRYQFGGYRWAGFIRGVAQLPVERMTALSFRAHAEPRVRIHVVIEQRDGAKFEATTMAGPGPPRGIVLPLQAFRRIEGGAGKSDKMDLAQVRAVIFVADTFSTHLRRGQEGRYWISEAGLKFVEGK